jgi:hypothetical protein
MSEIDSVIESIKAGIDALKKASSLAESAEVPAEDRAALEQAQETLQAMSDRMYDLAMTRGTTQKISTMHIELKDREQEQ